MFWLHNDCGYTFTGENTLYKLTIPEMRILYAGYQASERMAEDQSKGVKSQHRENLSDFDKRLKEGEFESSGQQDVPEPSSLKR